MSLHYNQMHGYVSIIAFHNEGDWWMDQWKRVSRTNRPISQIPNLSHVLPCTIQKGNLYTSVLIGVVSDIWAGALWDFFREVYCHNSKRQSSNCAMAFWTDQILRCYIKLRLAFKHHQIIFTRGQFWTSAVVVSKVTLVFLCILTPTWI